MRLMALVESPGHVCSRYRVEAFRPFLESAGHSLELVSAPRRWWRWGVALWKLRRADAVIVQRRLLHPLALRLLRRAARALVFDFDDAIWMNDSYDRRGLESPARERRFAAIVGECDAVVAGNSFLRAEAGRWCDPARVQVIPTCVNSDLYRPANHRRRGPGLELVWIGSSSTLQGLERIQPMLEEVGAAVPGLRMKLVCDRFLRLRHMGVIEVPWSEAVEAEALATADVGISWLPDDPWSRGKCGLKVLQYMAAGLPVIANPVGVQAEMVEHGTTGFLATTPREWCEATGRLAAEPGLRRRMGEAGRRRFEERYSVRAGAESWLGLLEDLARKRQAA